MTRPEEADERVGTLVADKYRIARLLGSGGMGNVYEGENVTIGKRVALKFLHMTAQQDEISLLRFQREARVISTVQSAHIVQVFDWGQDAQGQPFLVMEYLEGRDLSERLRAQGPLPVGEAVRFAVEGLRGLRRVHAAGIVHRDLKPENLFVVPGDDDRLHVKIVDFGLSKLMDPPETPDFQQSARLTQDGAIVGTPLYMSPEQVEAIEEVDHRADLWAVGAILHEMLAGSPPFMDRSYARLVMAICQRDPQDLTQLNPAVPASLAAVVRHALTRTREQRFQRAETFIEALASIPVLDDGPGASSVARPLGGRALSPLPGAPPSGSSPYATSPSVQVSPAVDPVPGGPARAVVSSEAPPAGSVAVTQTEPAAEGGPLDATIAAQTKGAATVWLSDAPVFSIWRGEVDAPDRLRIEARDGSIRDLRLEPVGILTLGRVKTVGGEVNDLVYPDVASRLAARLHHDGVRWWLERREECSVPVQVGTRSLARGERAPMVHGTFVTVGAMRATLVDRRYVSRSVPSDTVDAQTGLLARGGLEQEVATALQQEDAYGLVLVLVQGGEGSLPAAAATAVHRGWPTDVVARQGDVVTLLVRGDDGRCAQVAGKAAELATEAGVAVLAVGHWSLAGESQLAGSEVELAFDALDGAAMGRHSLPGGDTPPAPPSVVALRDQKGAVRLSLTGEVVERAKSPKQQMLLFGIEEQAALSRIGPKVVGALEQELAAMVSSQVGPSAMVAKLGDGVLGVSFPRKIDAAELGVQVQCEWHARAPITDGAVELPRSLSWEDVLPERADTRAKELSRECADAHGVLSALSGGLPYPIAGRVHAAIGSLSAVERVKMLFDVLEGTWRFIAIVLAAAYFAKARTGEVDEAQRKTLLAYYKKVKTRAGLPLGSWRELARLSVKGFSGQDDPIGRLAAQVLDVKLSQNQTFDQLSNLLHSERNNFAHGHYNEARAAGDVAEFEQMTRAFLRALRPLAAWTLVTVQRTEPDLYGESQTVEFLDHTGPHLAGARRRIGFMSPVRLAHVCYLARWRDGLVLPLDPWMRRLASEDRFDLYWIDHLPREGNCHMSATVSGESLISTIDARRLPPLLRELMAQS